jgi:hypothetical protein
MIKTQIYPIHKLTITNQLLASYINNFWVEIFKTIKEDSHLMLMCKVQFSNDSSYRTLGHLRKVNFEDKELFIDYLTQRLSILTDSYMTTPISNIIFSYIIKPGKCTDTDRALLQDLTNKSISTHGFNNMVLPASMDPRDYGDILVDNYIQLVGGENIHRFIVKNESRIYKIDISSDGLVNKVRIEGTIDLEWVDTKISKDIGDSIIFMREIKKTTIYFMDGEVVLRKQELPAKPFKN